MRELKIDTAETIKNKTKKNLEFGIWNLENCLEIRNLELEILAALKLRANQNKKIAAKSISVP